MRGAWLTDDLGNGDIPPPLDAEAYGHNSKASPIAPVAIDVVRASDFAGMDVPPRPWLVRDLVPDKSVTIITGDGGVGKSLLALQLAVAVGTGTDWVGALPEYGPVLYLSAEDDLDEIHRRLADIVSGQGLALADLQSFHIVPLAGRDAVLGTAARRDGIIGATPLWRAIVEHVCAIRPRLVIIDNLADSFAGNENARPEARQFIGLLRGVAIEYELAILLISHPSLTGIASGTGASGSTAWSNSVRSRLYLDRAVSEDGDEPDPALRILRVKKSNYAAAGGEIRLKWKAGRFEMDGRGVGTFDRMVDEQRAERVFLELLKRNTAEGREVSHKRSASYAPTVFAKQPGAEGIGKAALEVAMNRLFAAGSIKSEKYGPPSREISRIVEIEGEKP